MNVNVYVINVAYMYQHSKSEPTIIVMVPVLPFLKDLNNEKLIEVGGALVTCSSKNEDSSRRHDSCMVKGRKLRH